MDLTGPVPLGLSVPFVLLLLAIAGLPLAAPHWWERNRSKALVAAVCALPVALWCLASGRADDLALATHEYLHFIVLLGALYVVAGGVFVDCDLRATPRVNCAFLAVGAVLANVAGTTGASMLLIRPLLHTNSERRHVAHTVVFFIFVVSNCGGLLTPLGDPPLFMGYLRGVPFAWTLGLWPWWLGVNGALLLAYLVWDSRMLRRETAAALRLDRERFEPLRLQGTGNLALLAAIVACVALLADHPWLRDGILAACVVASLTMTGKGARERNAFRWEPIVEVAVLFAGIFVTMIPALRWLQQNGTRLGVDTPQEFFWTTGTLSAVLDNAPTYLTFASVAASQLQTLHPGVSSHRLDSFLDPAVTQGPALLAAISAGAVLMGAMTYIGNGPNFMVKAIAESRGVRMPGFFGYVGYSVAVLLPILVVAALLLI